MNKKGVSDVVATVLIILLVLAAVIIVWQVVSNIVKGSSETVSERSLCIEARLESQDGSVVCYNGNTVNATIKRSGDSAGKIKMRVVAENNITDFDAPMSLGTKVVTLTNTGGIANGEVIVRVAPMVGANKDVICEATDEATVTCSSI